MWVQTIRRQIQISPEDKLYTCKYCPNPNWKRSPWQNTPAMEASLGPLGAGGTTRHDGNVRGSDLGRCQVGAAGSARAELGHETVDDNTIAHVHRIRPRGSEDKDAFGSRCVAVGRGVLHVKPVGAFAGDDAHHARD